MRILIIEDDRATSEFLSNTLSNHHYAVDAVADGMTGLEMAAQWDYDLILLDVLLPLLDGVEVCRRLRAQGCQIPILMLTMKDSNEDVIAGLDAGADDYVAKSCASSQLLARVRALLRRGGNASASPVLTWGLLCLDPASAQVTYNQQVIFLRPKEYNLLELLLRSPQRILSRSNIIDHLWSIEETPVEGSVTNLIKDLRQRLKSAGVNDDLIETVYGLGYRLKAFPSNTETKRDERKAIVERKEPPLEPMITINRNGNWTERTQQRMTTIQYIAERFRESLERRIETLEAAEKSLRSGNLSLQQQAIARTEAHKLAGGLGTFGCAKASKIAQGIEQLLEETSQAPCFANQFSQLLTELKQELAKPLTNIPIMNSHITSN